MVAPSLENCLQVKEATSKKKKKPLRLEGWIPSSLTPQRGDVNKRLIWGHKSPVLASSWDQLCGIILIPEAACGPDGSQTSVENTVFACSLP